MHSWLQKLVVDLRVRLVFLLERLLPIVSTKHDVLGVSTYLALVNSNELARAQEQLNLSIALIARYEPRAYTRLKTDLRGILVYSFTADARAQFNRSTRLCELSPSLVLTHDIVTIAGAIIHEGTHARLRRVRAHDPARRVEVERACLSQEIVFLEKLPGMGQRADEIRAVIDGLKPEDYTDAARWADMVGAWASAKKTLKARS